MPPPLDEEGIEEEEACEQRGRVSPCRQRYGAMEQQAPLSPASKVLQHKVRTGRSLKKPSFLWESGALNQVALGL